MEERRDENRYAVMEYPFDYKRYIEKQLRKIDDLDERRFAKTVLLEGLGNIIQCMEEKYQNLEQRIYRETEVERNCYETTTTIIKKDDYDPMNSTLFPVYAKDLEEDQLREELSSEDRIYIETIFLKADEKTVQKFQKIGKFSGVYKEEEIWFSICPTQRYRKQLQQLYQVFQDNHIQWETVHTGFLDKFFDVWIEGIEQIERGKEITKKPLEKRMINYGSFQSMICYNRIPLWNIEQIHFDSVNFMLPCIDGIYYEHEFNIPDAKEKDGYLIETNEDILEIRHENGKIFIKSDKETFEGWQALHMVQGKTVRSLEYTEPFLSNHKKDSFFEKLSKKTQVLLLTKIDLFRRIMTLNMEEYIEVIGYQVCDHVEEYPVTESMNWFVKDELFPLETRKVLFLQFREKIPEFYLNDSMVRFVISQIQLEVNEYLCIGIIKEEV